MEIKNNLDKRFLEIIESIHNKHLNKQLMLFDLFSFFEDERLERALHKNAAKYYNNSKIYPKNSKIEAVIIASLSVIAFKHYDGAYWSKVFDIYEELNDNITFDDEHHLQTFYRTIIKKTMDKTVIVSRYINYVLMQSIVPEYFLPDLLNILDLVYKFDFRGSLPDEDEELNGILHMIFQQISSKTNEKSDSFQSKISNKSYTLVATTRQVIEYVRYRQTLIKFTSVLIRGISNLYRNENITGFNQYIKHLLENWFASKEHTILPSHEHSELVWKTEFVFKDGLLYLQLKTVFLPVEVANNDITIQIYSQDKLVYLNEKPDIYIRENSAELSSLRILVDFNPFDITIKLTGTNLKDQKLNYNSLFFAFESGKFLGNSIKKQDTISVLYPLDSALEANALQTQLEKNYNYSVIDKENNECFQVDDETYCFVQVSNPYINGKRDDFIKVQYANKVLDLYNKKPSLVLPIYEEKVNIEISINNNLQETLNEYSNNGEKIIQLQNLKYGFNEVIIKVNGFVQSKKTFSFYFDDYSYATLKETLSIEFNSITLGNISIPINLIDEIVFEHFIDNLIQLKIVPTIPFYLYENEAPKIIGNYFWHEDFNYYGQLKIYGIDKKKLMFINEFDEPIADDVMVKMTSLGPVFDFDISILKIHTKTYSKLLFESDDNEETIMFLNRNYLYENDVLIDSKSKEIQVTINELYGRNRVDLKIQHQKHENIILKEKYLFQLKHSIHPYLLEILEHDQVVFSKEFYFLNDESIINQEFLITDVMYSHTRKKKTNDQISYIEIFKYGNPKMTFLKITRHHNDFYLGELYFETRYNKKIPFDRLNPVKIYLKSDLDDLNNMIVFIESKEGDYLQFDSNRDIIYNSINANPNESTEIEEYYLKIKVNHE